jgi:hypothetical protein
MGAMRGSTPDISVVVPVWDRYVDRFLDRALASLTTQDAGVEVIVVDNASQAPVRPNDDRVVVVRTPARLSCGAARNFGLAHVRTPLVVMWDADDVMLPGTIASLRNGIEGDSRLVAHAEAILDSDSGRRHRWPRRWLRRLTRRPRLLALINTIWSQYPTTGATVMRTEVVRDAGGYGETNGAEDWSLGAALLWRGRVSWSERPGRLYGRHEMSTWKRHSSTRHLLAHSRAVRAKLRADAAVPGWWRAGLILIQLSQYAAILLARPMVRLLRRPRPRLAADPAATAPLLDP